MNGKIIQNTSGFLTDFDILSEAEKFLEPGFFNSDLGYTVLLALANALGIQFVVFTTLECHHLVHVTPRQIKCGNPVYLAYIHRGCGHYDAIVPTGATVEVYNHEQNNSAVPEACTCGKNDINTLHTCHFQIYYDH